MENAIHRKLQIAKARGTINGDSLELIYAKILSDVEKQIAKKKSEIDRIFGGITQLKVTKELLLRALDSYLSSEKQTEADILRENQLIEQKRREADERLRKVMDDEGIDLNDNIVSGGTVKQEIDIQSDEDPVEEVVEKKEEPEVKQPKEAKKKVTKKRKARTRRA